MHTVEQMHSRPQLHKYQMFVVVLLVLPLRCGRLQVMASDKNAFGATFERMLRSPTLLHQLLNFTLVENKKKQVATTQVERKHRKNCECCPVSLLIVR